MCQESPSSCSLSLAPQLQSLRGVSSWGDDLALDRESTGSSEDGSRPAKSPKSRSVLIVLFFSRCAVKFWSPELSCPAGCFSAFLLVVIGVTTWFNGLREMAFLACTGRVPTVWTYSCSDNVFGSSFVLDEAPKTVPTDGRANVWSGGVCEGDYFRVWERSPDVCMSMWT